MQRIIATPEWPPHQCIATLKHEDPEGFIDTGLNVPFVEPRVILSVSYVKEQARHLGMVDAAVYDGATEALYSAQARIEELEQLVEEREALLDATDAVQVYAKGLVTDVG